MSLIDPQRTFASLDSGPSRLSLNGPKATITNWGRTKLTALGRAGNACLVCREIGIRGKRGIRARFLVEYAVRMKLTAPNAAGRQPRSKDRSARCPRQFCI